VYALSPTSQVLLAMSIGDGRILWVYPDQSSVPREILTGHTIATAASSNKLFILAEVEPVGVGSNTFNLLAVEKASGKLLWKSPNLLPQGISFDDFWSELCLAVSSIYFQLDGKLYGYSQDGKPLWPALTMFTVPSSSTVTIFNTPTPAFADGLIFVGTWDGRLLAVQSATGGLVWSVQLTTGDNAPVQSTPAAAGGLVYVGASDGYCYAFHAASGSIAWKTQVVNLAAYNANFVTGYSAFVGALTVSNDVVYLQAGVNYFSGLSGASLIALDATSGKQRWKVDPTKLALHLDPARFPTITGITGVAPWYPSGNVIYTTVGFQTANTSGSTSGLATAEALLALNQQDGSLNSYYWAPVDGQDLKSGFFPSAPVPLAGGVAFMTNEPGVYALEPVNG
jgi:outer membrane protein assembly factor BamB